MRSSVMLGLALVGISFTANTALAQRGRRGGEQSGGRYGWLSSLSAGKQLARTTGKPLMIVLRCVP